MVDGYNLCFVCFFCIVLLVCFCSTLLLKYKSPQGREGKHITLTHTQGTHKAHTHTHTHTHTHKPYLQCCRSTLRMLYLGLSVHSQADTYSNRDHGQTYHTHTPDLTHTHTPLSTPFNSI